MLRLVVLFFLINFEPFILIHLLFIYLFSEHGILGMT